MTEEEAKVEGIKETMSENQKRCDDDLARAEPAVRQAEAALDTLNKVLLSITLLITFPEDGTTSQSSIKIIHLLRARVIFKANYRIILIINK